MTFPREDRRLPSRSPYSRSVPFLMVLLALGASACDEAATNDAPDPTWIEADQPLALSPSTPPIDGIDSAVTFVGSIPYGDDAQQVFDVFLPPADEPTPAIVYVHGGGFTKGTRTDLYTSNPDAIRATLAAGVAFIGVDYRLLLDLGIESEGVRKSLLDSRRALQFIRFHAATLNLDPDRIAIYGGSAGAGTSVWLAFHDDMAQRSNPDRIARERTRVRAVAAVQTQATYDVLRWADDVFAVEYPIVSNDLLLSVSSAVDLLLRFYGLSTDLRMDPTGLMALLEGDHYGPYREDLDLLALASRDDPPIYLVTTTANIPPLQQGFDLLHHPLHAKALYEHSLAGGIEVVEADVPAYAIESSYDGPIPFLLDHL